ncbi:MAG: hypothetical protein OEY22_10940 [Candidatus Bathyarchaeota archaeon]|nr:hypothetical protein [Candidatus Bathyarchaeota archaeon]
MHGQNETAYPFGRFTFFLNILMLVLSVSLMFYIIFDWGIWDYLVILTYVLSVAISFLFFYSIKLALLKSLASDMESIEGQEPNGTFGKKQTFLFFIAILLLLITVPLIILFLIPGLWLIILNGIVAGASISELILYVRKRKPKESF